ncbi:MAG: class I SAM-dependent methyltransferase [Rhodanobacter sp.]|nr:MAG: class I SAM-dependent methyltransferase [Rhodanobacter sp.]TAM39347.1 MAG: class I SAM-dependent methyltransferase [Rhodanobacter sp.]
MSKTYDRDYFDKWYRDLQHAVGSPAELRRKVTMVMAQTEYYLGRPIRNVLDVGCGEATWRAALRKLRPGIAYRGLDPSEYVVTRYGRSRHVGLARFAQLEQLRFDTRFDLIVCTDVLHYLKSAEIRAGLHGIGEMLEGLAFLEVFTSRDDVAGDRQGFVSRPPSWYLREFARVGLLPCGSHCYLGPRLNQHVAALERAHSPG